MRAIGLLIFFQVRCSLRKIVSDPRRLIPALLLLAIYAYSVMHRGPLGQVIHPASDPKDAASVLENCRAYTFFVLALIADAMIGTGFTAAYLSFSVPDIDYLMSSPISRRTMLTLKILRVNATGLGYTVFLWLIFRTFAAPFFPPLPVRQNLGNFGELSLFLFIAGCMQIGVAIAAHMGKRQAGYVTAQLLLLGLVASAAWISIQLGPEVLVRVLNSPVIATLGFPCRWVADAMLLPLTGQSGGVAAALSFGFYCVSLILVFARNANFYETAFFVTHDMAQMKEVIKRTGGTGQNTAQFAERYQRAKKGSAPSGAGRPYSIPPFGSGAGAILWANLACMVKRPWLNFVSPLSLGLFLGGLVIWQPEMAGSLAALTAMLMAMLVLMGSISACVSIVNRQSLVGPLPIAPWKMACADILPLAFSSCLPIWILAAILAVGRVPDTAVLAILLVTCAPLIVVGLTAATYIAVANFAHLRQDAVAMFLIQMLLFVGAAIVVALYIPMLAAPASAGFAPWIAALAATPGCILVTGLMLAMAGHCCANLKAAGEIRTIAATIKDLPNRPSRMPALDESLWLYVLLLAGAFYGSLELVKYGLLVVVLCNEALYLAITLAFAWLGRYDWRRVFSWRAPSFGKISGAALMGAGIIPWIGGINFLQSLVWHANTSVATAALHFLATGFAAHPVLAPLAEGAMAGICEELAFRGPIQTALVNRFGARRGILICAFLFAAWHLDYSGLIFRTLVGVMLGWIVWRSKSIFPAMLAHAVIDASVFGYYSWVVHKKGIDALHSPSSLPPHFLITAIIGLIAGAALLAAGSWLVRMPAKASAQQPTMAPTDKSSITA
jgi:membrane protease YdiL (CAAX protease family)